MELKELSIFGSSLTEKFNKESDIDLLISFNENSHYGLFELAEMKSELEIIYGRDVDLVTRKSVEKSSNYIRKQSIWGNLIYIYRMMIHIYWTFLNLQRLQSDICKIYPTFPIGDWERGITNELEQTAVL